ncbi:MAG: cyclase family protein [Chloroflexota bacterium]
MATLIDLSHTVEAGMITYKGLPAPIICDYLSREASREHYAPGVEFHIGRLDMVANTGTYVDSPFHRYPDGKDLSELPLTSGEFGSGDCSRSTGSPGCRC